MVVAAALRVERNEVSAAIAFLSIVPFFFTLLHKSSLVTLMLDLAALSAAPVSLSTAAAAGCCSNDGLKRSF